MAHDWVAFAKQLRSIAQTGQTYTTNKYELERYRQLETLTNQMFAVLGDVPIERVENFIVPDRGYATPKVDVRGALFDGDRVLLVREIKDGRWTLPGGWADVNEGPSSCVLREIAEEAGRRASNPRLAMLKDRSLHPYTPVSPDHIYKLFYVCDDDGGEFVPNNETDAADFFALDALPPLSEGRTLAVDIHQCREFQRSGAPSVYSD
ncbi:MULTISPECIES: NUDIX hydrolase [unclassified Modicisalibacter]|uniref:NUDIX hydrolase n=1 Tax=unclassified Modicisalibacter TaxID=2679913 RepID=UPI001CCA791F|nr:MULTISPECIES: NUDIX hydrolase [unclassified Modicisalibacter]MBZ9557890.1 NUDIX hydrolase [Modicisalibacter sp. R2A 31.J]MBZ9573443.1 NUDIX hydrolase [Modicisalibacter sp. MOD 31.J]